MHITASLHDLYNIKLQFKESDRIEIKRNLNSWFSVYAPSYKFDWRYKKKLWDGKIRFFNAKENLLPIGLLYELKNFSKTFEYSLDINSGVEVNVFESFTPDEVKNTVEEFIESLNIPEDKITVRPYQYKYIATFMQRNIELLESPTASGKSLIIYACSRWAMNFIDKRQVLIIVPTIQLVEQMYDDFNDYGFDSEKYCAKIYSTSKDSLLKLKTDKKIIFSTWQSLYKIPEEDFENIGMVIGDEIHRFASKNTKGVIVKCKNAIFRLGTTGTLNDDKCSYLTIQGMFGKPVKFTTTKKLMDSGYISDVEINIVNLIYPEELCKIVKDFDYQSEVDFISFNEERKKFVVNLARKLVENNENSLFLFNLLDYGRDIERRLKEIGLEVYYVDGSVSMESRKNIQTVMEKKSGVVAVCSFKTFSTGINIKNLHNIIFLSSNKSKITTLQSTGRSLRKHKSKKIAKVWDIVDNLQWKKKLNFSLKHFIERKSYYEKEELKIKFHDIKL